MNVLFLSDVCENKQPSNIYLFKQPWYFCILLYAILLYVLLQEAYFRYMAENPTAGVVQEEEEDNLEYDSDGNPIAPSKKIIDPLPPIDHSEVGGYFASCCVCCRKQGLGSKVEHASFQMHRCCQVAFHCCATRVTLQTLAIASDQINVIADNQLFLKPFSP